MFWVALAETVITGAGLTLIYFNLKEAKRTADIARDQFSAAHRPLLVVRELDLSWVRDDTDITFVIINEGTAAAGQIVGEFKMLTRLAGAGVVDRAAIVLSTTFPEKLAPGKAVTCKGKVPSLSMPRAITMMGSKSALPATISFEGNLSYCGDTGIERRSAYYRPLKSSGLGFLPSDDPEREYPG
jgi:hypothetical protein